MHSLWTACVQVAHNFGTVCGHNTVLVHTQQQVIFYTRITTWLFRALYTLCVQKCPATVGKFTSVKMGFYTVYTGPITTTTN